MKRWIALALSASAALFVAAGPVAAAPGDGIVPATRAPGRVPADAIQVAFTNQTSSGLAATIDAGAAEEHALVLSNHTNDLRLVVKLSATDATGGLGTGPASWISFSDNTVQLEPHSAKNIPMKIAIPHDTQPGPVLVHVEANVESAVRAADGSPLDGTANITYPIAITVSGSATAQVAIVDVNRVDKDSHHQLGVVLRNFGNAPIDVTGHVRVAGDHPQTLKLAANLAAERDSTVTMNWNAPDKGTPVELAVDVEYGSGNVASWSSTLGAKPIVLDPQAAANSTATTLAPAPATQAAADTSTAAATPAKKSDYGGLIPIGIIVAVLAAGLWFFFELRRSRRRPDEVMMPGGGFYMPPPGWAPASDNASTELAKQLVRLTEIIVEMTTGEPRETPIRARSPDAAPVEPVEARAGPSPGDRDPPASARAPNERAPTEREVTEMLQTIEPLRSAPVAPSDQARPESDVEPEWPAHRPRLPRRRAAAPEPAWKRERAPRIEAQPEPEPLREPEPEPEPDPRAAIMERLLALDRDRRRIRQWMDTDEATFDDQIERDES